MNAIDYRSDTRTVMTLDAGGTNFVFSALRGGEEIVTPVVMPAVPDDLGLCLERLCEGFSRILSELAEAPVAISFAFPGPADYEKGIIGDLPNFPAFCGGVALGPFLEERFGIPVFINNDGNLFAYGEAHTGILPEINRLLTVAGSRRRYRNLLGVTLGTGFGAGVVIGGELLTGDNGVGGDIWRFRNKKHGNWIVEESVSIRAVKRVYRELSGDPEELTPKDIYDIAEGTRPGNRQAAIASFAELGEMAGDVLAMAVTLVDGLIVIGGGLAGAAKYILPSLMQELTAETGMTDGTRFSRIQMEAFDLQHPNSLSQFLHESSVAVKVPGCGRSVEYDPVKRIGVAVSRQGASRSIALGAYMYALNHLPR